ncbi:30S ribosomal protein S13 [Candidatus Roizmanbacteria bacterium RIFCSPLOWO2_01_FULL_42_14]|uniref:Small ribosomal subunit protein uS13 n=4 Tax=Candidatus Roizmaniibacteriota TaxID=1752723 RepID=A0A1F7JV27_9BACT|nr:MAG: 30S ribosomal protein S13 [Candidatus Roizmanbacteria bacterium RIFCSPHIGHO2_02_FULL_43_11]OGK38615.1 MAG: 30S ribosomal protein S13 [Candidatus Roizmanbacteria bacterium RIFCSPHIGHO2_12_FULL_42_10]OGK52209.1 MAG: 30S ribosomal protein S13 [Candidatus Roizmanbacteria bacterium RIFCSPLOWO2_01_FULL_42_14]OGK59442.1 MAG: 30S ribosomal protein S13 [Candidatus Roizmanbacteria bacterium RIFCSPLOWO2_02_FULL_43_10]
MVRISGQNLPDEKNIDFALTQIYGIGWTRSKNILKKAGLSENIKVKDLTEKHVQMLQQGVSEYKVEGELKEEVNLNIKRLRETGSYRGLRHARGLPTRGQRTRSNARTNRGKRKTVGAFKKDDIARMQQQQKKKT